MASRSFKAIAVVVEAHNTQPKHYLWKIPGIDTPGNTPQRYPEKHS